MKIPELKKMFAGSTAIHVLAVAAMSIVGISQTHNIERQQLKPAVEAVSVTSQAISSEDADAVIQKFKDMKSAQDEASHSKRVIIEDLKRESNLRQQRMSAEQEKLEKLKKEVSAEKRRLEELKKKS